MGLSPRLVARYLHHSRAVAALEDLRAVQVQAVPWMSARGRKGALEQWARTAEGIAPATAQEKAAVWAANWARARAGGKVLRG